MLLPVEVNLVLLGQAQDVSLVEKQGLVGVDGVLGQAAAKAFFGKPHTPLKRLIDVIREGEVALALVIKGDEKVAGVDDVAQFTVDALVKIVQVRGVQRPGGNAVIQPLRLFRAYFLGDVAQDAPKRGGFTLVVAAVDAARQKQRAAIAAPENGLERGVWFALLHPLQPVDGARHVIGVEHVAQGKPGDLVGTIAQQLTPSPVDENKLAIQRNELNQVAGVIHQILQLRVGVAQGRGHPPLVGEVFANDREGVGPPAHPTRNKRVQVYVAR